MAQPYTIATIGSHSALQILKGAKDEGFKTICVCIEGRDEPYKSFGVADEIITIPSYKDFSKAEEILKERNAIIIPHASFIAYMGIPRVEALKVPYFGNKGILNWESDRKIERKWLTGAGIRMPSIYDDPKDIDGPVITKFHGAKGGEGYFVAKTYDDWLEKMKSHEGEDDYVIQEYIVGVPCYIHYFYSSITDEIEVLGFDKRYESNVDGLGRISARDQYALPQLDPSYVIVGNVPIVVRESLLPQIFSMGRSVVEESKNICPPGLFGPFCLECIITPNLDIYVFEISARIVAGTNPFVNGSPYSWLKYNEPMSTGRRIAREIKVAISKGKVQDLLQ